MTTSFPFANRPGECFIHAGVTIRLDRFAGSGVVHFTDLRTAGPYQIEDDDGHVAITTVTWMAREFAAGRLKSMGPVVVDGTGREVALPALDAAAAAKRDPKATWRFDWAFAAYRAPGLMNTDDAYEVFIKENEPTLGHPRYGSPSASTLRRLVRSMRRHGVCHSVFVGRAGRPRGLSQLTPTEDLLVHEYAIRFYASPDWPRVADAYSFLDGAWRELRDAGSGGLSPNCPTYETLRLRIKSMLCRETAEAKWGAERAAAMFEGNGEVDRPTRPFERVVMDGFEIPAFATFDDDLPIAATKMRSVLLFDSVSTFAWVHTFAGPYRSEASQRALLRMLLPPDNLTPEQEAEAPEMSSVWIVPETIVPDNDKTLIGPETVVGLARLGATIDLPRTYDSNAKAEAESFGKLIQARLAGLPGRVFLTRPRRDFQRDPVREAEVTMHQMRAAADDVVWVHNTTRRDELGGRSPLEVVVAHFKARGGPVITDRDAIRRSLARTIENRVLDENGVVVDGIRYRNGPEGDVVGDVLRAGHARTPMKGRRTDQATVKGDLRVFDWNLDQIEFFDDARKVFVRLWSDDPDYTAGLDRHVHGLYRAAAKERGEAFDTAAARHASRRRTLEANRERAPKVGVRARANFAALWDNETLRSMSGRRAEKGMPPPLSGAFPAGPVGDTHRRPDPPPPSSTALGAPDGRRGGADVPERGPGGLPAPAPENEGKPGEWDLPDDVDDDMED